MYGYNNRWLDIDLTNKTSVPVSYSEDTLRAFLGGCGMGAKILYDRVPPGVEWNDPENCVIICGGVLNGSKISGSGSHCQVTKGALTNGAASSQAMGYLGAYLFSSGVDGLIVHGKADDLTYLYVHDGAVEFRDASPLAGMPTYDAELKIKELIGKPDKQSSVYAIGPAGENLVRFACIAGDHGHIVAHNGIGAVWGSKNLKALAVDRGTYQVDYFDEESVKRQRKQLIEETFAHPHYKTQMEMGTAFLFRMYNGTGLLPFKNLTSSVIPEEYRKLEGEYYRSVFESKREPCFACPSDHCNIIKVTEGKYKGFVGEEPEYELMAGMGSMIGNPEPGAAMMLANQWDLVGCDGNEGSWLTAFAIECFERGILTLQDTDGLELRWGNAEAINELIWKIAKREGIGNLLAEGVKRSAEAIGGEALDIGVYQMRGHAPRGHDHRARWVEIFDTAVSNCGTNENTHYALTPEQANSPDGLSYALYRGKTRMFVDSLVVCMIMTRTMTLIEYDHICDLIKSVAGWDYNYDEALGQAHRTINVLRSFNIRHGIGPDVEYPSRRYGSAPVDGPHKGKNIMDIWEETLDKYYGLMGWDRKSGRPHKETLAKMGIEYIIQDLY